jgi:hypothetical protein
MRASAWTVCAAATCFAAVPVLAACPGDTRDVATGGTEHTVVDAGGPVEAYEHVAKRAHAMVGLAEARGLDKGAAKQAVELLADRLEGCVAQERARGPVPAGAVRVVAYVDAAGAVGPPKVTSSGGDAGRIALLCVAAPLRLLAIPPVGDAGATPGLAIEASWSE